MDLGRSIPLVDETLTNLLIADFEHHLADESWNCPADEMFRRTPLREARIVHYFADGVVLDDSRRLGRNRETEAGRAWFDAFDEMRAELPIEQWTTLEESL
jgi:hypothetical protein